VYGMFMIGQGALIVPGNIPDWWIWDYYNCLPRIRVPKLYVDTVSSRWYMVSLIRLS
jgi:hypothetical protein